MIRVVGLIDKTPMFDIDVLGIELKWKTQLFQSISTMDMLFRRFSRCLILTRNSQADLDLLASKSGTWRRTDGIQLLAGHAVDVCCCFC